MQKPDDIPQDIWDAGEAVAAKLYSGVLRNPGEHIARAILAERRACAELGYKLHELYSMPKADSAAT